MWYFGAKVPPCFGREDDADNKSRSGGPWLWGRSSKGVLLSVQRHLPFVPPSSLPHLTPSLTPSLAYSWGSSQPSVIHIQLTVYLEARPADVTMSFFLLFPLSVYLSLSSFLSVSSFFSLSWHWHDICCICFFFY